MKTSKIIIGSLLLGIAAVAIAIMLTITIPIYRNRATLLSRLSISKENVEHEMETHPSASEHDRAIDLEILSLLNKSSVETLKFPVIASADLIAAAGHAGEGRLIIQLIAGEPNDIDGVGILDGAGTIIDRLRVPDFYAAAWEKQKREEGVLFSIVLDLQKDSAPGFDLRAANLPSSRAVLLGKGNQISPPVSIQVDVSQ